MPGSTAFFLRSVEGRGSRAWPAWSGWQPSWSRRAAFSFFQVFFGCFFKPSCCCVSRSDPARLMEGRGRCAWLHCIFPALCGGAGEQDVADLEGLAAQLEQASCLLFLLLTPSTPPLSPLFFLVLLKSFLAVVVGVAAPHACALRWGGGQAAMAWSTQWGPAGVGGTGRLSFHSQQPLLRSCSTGDRFAAGHVFRPVPYVAPGDCPPCAAGWPRTRCACTATGAGSAHSVLRCLPVQPQRRAQRQRAAGISMGG